MASQVQDKNGKTLAGPEGFIKRSGDSVADHPHVLLCKTTAFQEHAKTGNFQMLR